MAKGVQSKEKIFEVLRTNFPEYFMNGKEFRIPMIEDGEEVQIKVALTAAKDNVPHGEAANETKAPLVGESSAAVVEPTKEEKEKVVDLATLLGLI